MLDLSNDVGTFLEFSLFYYGFLYYRKWNLASTVAMDFHHASAAFVDVNCFSTWCRKNCAKRACLFCAVSKNTFAQQNKI